MSVSSTTLSVRYVGNGSTSTTYAITFPFLETSHIVAAVSSDGEEDAEELSGSAYVVTRDEDGQGGTLRTVTAVTSPAEIVISRVMPLTQPTELQNAGPLPAESVETAFDRVAMQIQQVDKKVDDLAAGGDVTPVTPDGGASALSWENAAARSSVKPLKAGQLGVQISDQTLWISQSATLGDWALSSTFGKFVVSGRAYLVDESIDTNRTGVWWGGMPAAAKVAKVFVCCNTASDDTDIDFVVKAAGVTLASGTLLQDTTFKIVDCVIPSTEIAVGARLTVDVTIGSGGSSRPTGLDVTLVIQSE